MTTRDPDALLIRKWAESGDVQTPEAEGLTRATGWPSSYSQVGGDTPSRETFNQMFREITGMLEEINKKGILVWDSTVNYEHPAYVIDSGNFRIYQSVRDNVNKVPRDSADDWKAAFPVDGEYIPHRVTLPSTLTDFNDIDSSLLTSTRTEVIWFHDLAAMVDNRPFDIPTSSRLECLLMQRPGSTDTLTLRAFLIDLTDENLRGISYFERFTRDGGSTWSQWGAYPVLSTVYAEDLGNTTPTYGHSVNCSGVTRALTGGFDVDVPYAPATSETMGWITGAQLSIESTHNIDYKISYIVDLNPGLRFRVNIVRAGTNTAYNPNDLSLTLHMNSI